MTKAVHFVNSYPGPPTVLDHRRFASGFNAVCIIIHRILISWLRNEAAHSLSHRGTRLRLCPNDYSHPATL